MQSVTLDDPVWRTTFPHRVMPLTDEWLPGLLLRCDETNHWTSRTTFDYVLSSGKGRFDKTWRAGKPYLDFPASFYLDYLAELLAIPKSELLATTYQVELSRLYEIIAPHPVFVGRFSPFHLCPICVTEARLLRRILILPHITLCPQHQVILLKQCQCGAPLRPFHRQALPFTCHVCGVDWADLPRIQASGERLVLEQKIVSWYEFLFYHGVSLTRRHLMQFIYRHRPLIVPDDPSEGGLFGSIIAMLVRNNFSPDDIKGDL